MQGRQGDVHGRAQRKFVQQLSLKFLALGGIRKAVCRSISTGVEYVPVLVIRGRTIGPGTPDPVSHVRASSTLLCCKRCADVPTDSFGRIFSIVQRDAAYATGQVHAFEFP